MRNRFLKTALMVVILTVIVSVSAFAGSKTDNIFNNTAPLWMVGGIVINAASLASLQKNFVALFKESFDAMEPIWPKVAMESPSVGSGENYQWLGDIPQMREWLGDKVIKQLSGFDYYVKNKSWEVTLGVDRDDLEDDRLGIYRPRIMQLAEEGAMQPDALLTTVREAGTSSLCYDGKNFYATNHSIGKSGTLSNLLTGTGKTVALVSADFRSARAAMRKYKTDTGRPFIRRSGKLAFVAVIPPDLEGVFEDLLNQTMIGGSSNVLKGAFDYVVDTSLTNQDDWYLDYVGAPIRPFLFQNRKSAEMVALDNPNASDMVFLKKKFLFSCESRNNMGYGLWQFSIKINN